MKHPARLLMAVGGLPSSTFPAMLAQPWYDGHWRSLTCRLQQPMTDTQTGHSDHGNVSKDVSRGGFVILSLRKSVKKSICPYMLKEVNNVLFPFQK